MSLSGSARDNGAQVNQYIRRRVQVTDLNLASGYKIGRLPIRAFIDSVKWYKATAFNSTSTDTLQLGTTAAGVDILAATDVHTTGFVNHTSAAGLGLAVTASAEQDIYVKWVSGGGTPNAGDCTITVTFTTNNDG